MWPPLSPSTPDDTRKVFARNLVGRSSLAFDYWVPEIDLVGLNALAVNVIHQTSNR